MKLLDTCIWIEALAGSTAGLRYQSLLANPQDLVVSTLVIFELRKWLLRTLAEPIADQIMVILHSTSIVAPDESTALYAAELCVTHKLHALDALIYATALSASAELVTCDAHFQGLPGVSYRPKEAALPNR